MTVGRNRPLTGGASHERARIHQSPRATKPAPISASTPTIPSIGIRGAPRRSSRPASSIGPSSSASATRRATGATSWSTRASRTRRSARILNEHFVSIKVDREERPDLDQIYMTAVQLLTRQGGWPMSVFLTPDLKPFYGGTYFPPARRVWPAVVSSALLACAGRRLADTAATTSTSGGPA